jgi:hypothetical protein
MYRSMLLATVAVICLATAAVAAPPDPELKNGAVHQISQGCIALDPAGAVFVDPSARQQTLFTPPKLVHILCAGHLMPSETPPTAPVHFTEKTAPANSGFACLSRFSETIEVDGSFTLVCHSKPNPPQQ